MRKTNQRRLLTMLLAGGCLFAGPCGITTLQFRDFLTNSLIQTSVSTLASLVEAAIVSQGQEAEANGGG
jgi:hypothetical protein